MSDTPKNNENSIEETTERKKVSLQELMKQQLANKKQAQASGKKHAAGSNSPQRMKSQQAKKPSNTRRKMGV